MSMDARTILLVEDDEDDVFTFRRAVKKARVLNPVAVVNDGKEAIEYLGGAGRFADRTAFPLPFLVFLDLKLPYASGFEVLQWIREKEDLEHVVVVVLSSSNEERDHAKAYRLGARSYIVKPPDEGQLLSLFKSLEPHWARFGSDGPVRLGPHEDLRSHPLERPVEPP